MTLSVKPFGREPLHGKRVVLEMASPEHAEFLTKTYKRKEFMDCYRLAQDRQGCLQYSLKSCPVHEPTPLRSSTTHLGLGRDQNLRYRFGSQVMEWFIPHFQ